MATKKTKQPKEPVYLIINESTGDRKQVYEDDVRMAVGFLDTDRLMDVAPFKSFVAIVKMTRAQIQHQRKFSYPVKELMNELGIENHDYAHLEASFHALMSTVLDFNVHKHDRNPGWDMAQILGPSKLEDGIVHFQFTEPVWEKLKDPIVYAYLATRQVYNLTSKYEIALYNWFLRMLVPNRFQVICEISVENLMLNILKLDPNEKHTYSTYARFNEKLLSPYVKSLNAKTDMHIEYKGIRANRRVQKLQFVITRKLENVGKQGAGEEAKTRLSKAITRALKVLVDGGLWLDKKLETHLLELIEQHGEDECLRRLNEVIRDFKSARSKLKNPGGYLRTKLLQQSMLELSERSDEAGDSSDLVASYAELLKASAEAIASQQDISSFISQLRSGYADHLPTLKALMQENPALRAAARNLSPEDPVLFLAKASLNSLLYGFHERFGYEAAGIDTQRVMAQQLEEVIKRVRNHTPPEQLLRLREQAAAQGMKLNEVEALAIDLLSEQEQ